MPQGINIGRAAQRRLVALYHDPEVPGALRGVKGVQAIARDNGIGRLTNAQAKAFLEDQNAYTLHGRVHKGAKNLTERIVASWPYDLWEADIMEPPKTHLQIGRMSYLLVVIDVYTKFAMVRVIKNKDAKTVGNALLDVIRENVPEYTRLNHLRTDAGTEFFNTYCQNKVYKPLGINHYRAQKEPGAPVAERFIRTLAERMTRYIDHYTGTTQAELMEKVPQFVDSYNRTIHTTNRQCPHDMQMHAYDRGSKSGVEILQDVAAGGPGTVAPDTAPLADVKEELEGDKKLNLAAVFQSTTLGRNKRPNPWDPLQGEKIDMPLAPGTYVRLLNRPDIFRKGSRQKSFTDEVFKVKEATRSNPNAYFVTDDAGETIKGKLYRRQLQGLTNRPRRWEVRVLGPTRTRRGRLERLVEWVGHPHLQPEWIPDRDVSARRQSS
jgi:hypothetical protein